MIRWLTTGQRRGFGGPDVEPDNRGPSRLDHAISPADRSWGIGPLCLRRTASAAKGRDGHSRTAWARKDPQDHQVPLGRAGPLFVL